MSRICLFPGTFDPVTLGHVDIIYRAIPLFDKIIVGIGKNTIKAPMFSAEQRLAWIEEIYKDKPCIEGAIYEGLTVHFCKKVNAGFILRSSSQYPCACDPCRRADNQTLSSIKSYVERSA